MIINVQLRKHNLEKKGFYMLAVVKDKKGPGFTLKEVEIPKPKDDEVLIKVKAVGICGTDLSIINGNKDIKIPMIPGHEFSGDIVEVGKKVKEFKVGDRVSAAIVISCGNCYYCRKGLETLCDNIIETGIHVNGAFAEYVAVNEKVLYKLPDGMTYEQGASIDPIASAYHSIKKASIGSEDVVIVFGPGPIGIYILQIAKVEGAKKAICVGLKRNERRLALAKQLGADYIFNFDEILGEEIKRINNNELADVAFVATGSPQALNAALNCVRKHGKIVLVGMFHELVTANIVDVVRREIQVEGSMCYSGVDFKECIDLVKSGRIKVESLITHTFRLAEISKALEVINKGNAMKILLYP